MPLTAKKFHSTTAGADDVAGWGYIIVELAASCYVSALESMNQN